MHRLPNRYFDLSETKNISDCDFLSKCLRGYFDNHNDYYSFKSALDLPEHSDDPERQLALWAIHSAMHYVEVSLEFAASLEGMLGTSPSATHPAACVLLRQSIECALIAKWLLQPESKRQLAETGFAVTYRNLKKQRKYASAASDCRMPWMSHRLADSSAINKMLDHVSQMGQALGFMESSYYVNKYLPGYNQLFTQCTLKGERINLRWVYELLSSVSHGDVLGFNPTEHEFAQIAHLNNLATREGIEMLQLRVFEVVDR